MNQGMGQPNLNTDLVRNIAVPFPPPTEQREIADFLDMRCQRSRELVLLNQNQIAKFREYRQALISAAVTGKLAVPQEVNHAD
jgi:type I restriction enzyme S subunit